MFRRTLTRPGHLGYRWGARCRLCRWEGQTYQAGRHARDHHGARLFDCRTIGLLERYRVRR